MNEHGRLSGKVIAVAGGGGIGDGTALRFAQQGATVYLGDLDEEGALAAAGRFRQQGLSVTGMRLDGADPASVAEFFSTIDKTHGGVDGVLVNFASFGDAGFAGSIQDLPIEVYDETMRVNGRGYVLCTQAALPLLVARGGGSIVYTSSGSAHDGAPIRAAYAMSKAAGHALMRHVASAFGPQGIRANSIAPGYIFHHSLREHAPELEQIALDEAPYKKRVGEVSDFAALAELLMSDDGGHISGQVISLDAGITMRP